MKSDPVTAAYRMRGAAAGEALRRPARPLEAQEVVEILGTWGADAELQAAALLAVDWLESGQELDAVEVTQQCGAKTGKLFQHFQAFERQSPLPLTAGVTAQEATKRQAPPHRRGAPAVLQRIHAFCGAYQEPELAFLYVALLWRRFIHVSTVHNAPARAQEEAELLLAPLLEMLGMRELSAQVQEWLGLQRQPIGSGMLTLRPHQLQTLVSPLQEKLPNAHFHPGSYTQTHIPTTAAGLAVSATGTAQTYAIDVVVEELPDCYAVLYHINQLYTPVEGGVTDHLNSGRINGYRFLATVVWAPVPAAHADTAASQGRHQVGSRKVRVQFRIATRELDEINRWGLAAFCLRSRLQSPLPVGWWSERAAGCGQIDSDKPGTLPETLYVFSPHGQLFKFHRGATVVDYAYQVHSELADRCLRFTINGETVEPTAVLRHLDLVELEHDAHAPGPTQAWLNAARTSRARTKIQRFLKRRGQGVDQGEQIVAKQLAELAEHYGFSMPDYRINQMVRRSLSSFQLAKPEDFYTEIAGGRLDAGTVLRRFFAEELIGQIELPADVSLRRSNLDIAQCCRPRPGEQIVGRARRRGGAIMHLRVHRADCPRVADLAERPEDCVPVIWRRQPKLNMLAQLELTAQNEDRLLGEAVAQVYAVLPQVTLHRAEAVARRGVAHITFIVEAEDRDVLDRIVQALKELPGRNVDQVRLMDVSPTEREDLASVLPSSIYNPYSRLPVHEREMFFGRKAELQRIESDLQANVGAIWLRGQKRVGKTSLLLHLKKSYLEQGAYVPIYVDFQMLSRMDGPTIFFEVASSIFNDLQANYPAASYLDALGPPLRELFEHEAARQLMSYLIDIQRRLGKDRLVLLIDEFSRTIDAWERERLPADFFDQWRGLILNTRGINFVTVIQQRTYDRLDDETPSPEREPVWELLELGEQIVLRPLNKADVERLIEWPIQGSLEYPRALIDYIADLTGGSPFLIQAFCYKLVTNMKRRHARQVDKDAVEAVCREFMHPSESLFAHLLDLIQGIGAIVVQTIADLSAASGGAGVTWSQLREALPYIKPAQLRRTLLEMTTQDVLIEKGDNRWRFSSLLFQQWLCANPIA